MKLVTYSCRGRRSIGKVSGNQIIDLPASDPALPATMLELLQAGPAALERAGSITAERAVSYPLTDVRLEAPVPNPSKFMALGLNYKKHLQEAIDAGIKVPDSQVWFNKQVSCINGPYDPVHLPPMVEKLDYEAELGVVIGRRCHRIGANQAPSVIAGYMICNDVSARDWQLRSPSITLGKSFNTHGPIGPWIVTADELPDPHSLRIRMLINGEVRQDANTSDMIYNIWEQIAYLSTVMTLEPGDLLSTGTPAGVGMGMKPPQFRRIGDVMRVEIERIGHIENVVIAEPSNEL